MGPPALQYHADADPAALAYLEGLECGARIMRERYHLLMETARSTLDDMRAGYSPAFIAMPLRVVASVDDDSGVKLLAEALAELED